MQVTKQQIEKTKKKKKRREERTTEKPKASDFLLGTALRISRRLGQNIDIPISFWVDIWQFSEGDCISIFSFLCSHLFMLHVRRSFNPFCGAKQILVYYPIHPVLPSPRRFFYCNLFQFMKYHRTHLLVCFTRSC